MCVRDSIVRGMQLIRSGSERKYFGFTSIVRNASFSSGWLHLAVQCFFAVLIVVSFILIILMSIPKYPDIRPIPERTSRCHTKNCMVQCEDAPYFGKYGEDIYNAVLKVPDTCMEYHLTLFKPMFVNEILPTGWIPRMRLPLHELAIMGGNLKHFPPDAFLNQHAASVRTLMLIGLDIKTWTRDSLVGLSNLVEIYIKECTIAGAPAHVLRPVHDTLTSLTITESKQWNPANVTGTTPLNYLTTVDFSHNIFYNILNKNSFTRLHNCKILYLNSCKISAISAGAFDNLHMIETLFLNNNLLLTVPEGLFKNIISITPKPRINLQDNLWKCDCSASDIRQLVGKDMLLTDPSCNSPKKYKGKTFFEFELYCNDEDDEMDINNILPPDNDLQIEEDAMSGFIYVNQGCYIGQENSSSNVFQMMSPVFDRRCPLKEINKKNISTISQMKSTGRRVSQSNWIKFTFILKTNTYSMVQITATEATNYGILWYQSSCPNEVYCVNSIPSALRVYNVDMSAQYIFCPILLASGDIEDENCVYYNFGTIDYADLENNLHISMYVCTGVGCLMLGAICVYALVRKHPNLLKGSERILFVKHKNVEALVLPPKVPVRNNLMDEATPELNDKTIFIVSANSLASGKFNRNKSTRSSKSNAPSYISALQPTEDQLAEWRIQNHFTNDVTTELGTYSWLCSADSFHYTDVIDNDRTYESLK